MKPTTASENRALISLALILSFRMLGLFMIFPVFTLYAIKYHAATPTLIGMALGAYGLTQAILQLPLSALSDRVGRKPILTAGLLLFALGSVVSALTHNIYILILGRALQGSGAIGSTLMAMAADYTSIEKRTKAMAILGLTIGLSFAIAIILGPLITQEFHLAGIFWLTALFALCGLVIIYSLLPAPPKRLSYLGNTALINTVKKLAGNSQLLPLNLSILLLHAILTACFSVIPIYISHNLQIPPNQLWALYLPVLLGALVTIFPFLYWGERRNKIKPLIMMGITVITMAELLFYFDPSQHLFIFSFYLFFTGFTLLEALLPAMISKIVPSTQKGSAMGIYSSYQFFGIFLGGMIAGLIRTHSNNKIVFLSCALFSLIWLTYIATMKKPGHYKTKIVPLPDSLDGAKTTQIAQNFLKLSGVIDVELSHDHRIAYLHVDTTIFNQDSLSKFACNDNHSTIE